MHKLKRRICALTLASALAFSAAAVPAWAGGTCPPPPPSKCNSGNGNGSDVVTFVAGAHCYGGDPGGSYVAGNKGGDEVPPGVPNPGGNNVAP